MFECYNENTHNCDSRCQGATNCPLAHDIDISKEEMKLYIEDAIVRKEEWDKFIKELHKDEEFLKEIEKLKMKLDISEMVYVVNKILSKNEKIYLI